MQPDLQVGVRRRHTVRPLLRSTFSRRTSSIRSRKAPDGRGARIESHSDWSSATLGIPLDPNRVGLPVAHQAAIFGANLIFTNATASTIGW